MKIRPYTRKDIPRILALAKKLFHEHHYKCMTVDLHYQHGFVAEEAEEIVGFASCSCEDRIPYLSKLAVVPSMRRQGIGSRLVAAVEQEARRSGAHCVQLKAMGWTRPYSRTAAGVRSFYRSLGFEVMKKGPIYDESKNGKTDRWRIYTFEKRWRRTR